MYKHAPHNFILRLSDNTFIPQSEDNADYREYLAWLASGNTPEPTEIPDPNQSILAQIDQLERESMLNRGSRELQLFLMEERAAQVATARGVPVAAVLAANIYYSKLKPLDDQIAALREKIK